MSRFYLAYGCNLNLEIMSMRCPDAQAVCPVVINGHRLCFAGTRVSRWGRGGVATLIRDDQCTTSGALYLLTGPDEEALDGFEGIDEGFYAKREDFSNWLQSSALVQESTVFSYLLAEPQPVNHPPVKYIRAIRQGYVDWDLPGHPLVK